MSAWWWLAGGVALAAAEMVLPGVYLLWVGLGAVATGLLALAVPALALEWQLVAFAAAAVAAALAGHAFYRRTLHTARPTLNRRAEEMIGARGHVEDAIANGRGRVRIGDSGWLARGPDLPAGTPIRVVGCDAATLVVAPVEPEGSAAK
jgi:membrane protein implicated in regulation of membrane protease activity